MQSGGPGWNILLGRLDGLTSSKADAENLPGPFDGLPVLRAKFRNATLDDTTDLVALSGKQTRSHNSITSLHMEYYYDVKFDDTILRSTIFDVKLLS
jgi:hypothetical protein